MSPLRRYLRITKYTVLEVRIYLDNPALAQTWLLHPRDPILPKVMESIRPLVLPKLREERERSKKKGSKKKSIKDVIVHEDFEVSIFLTETDTRHSLLVKHKYFHDDQPKKLQSNSTKLTSASADAPIDLEAEDMADEPMIRAGESDEDAEALDSIPAIAQTSRASRSKRPLELPLEDSDFEAPSEDDQDVVNPDGVIDLEDEDYEDMSPVARPSKRARRRKPSPEIEEDKKKMAMDVSYEGFALYGRVLCLVVKRREGHRSTLSTARGITLAGASNTPRGQAAMENWISSTQVPAGSEEEDKA